jgi:hypothetical protein
MLEDVGPVDYGNYQSVPEFSRLEQSRQPGDSRIADVNVKFFAQFTACLNRAACGDKLTRKAMASGDAISSSTCPLASPMVYAPIHPHGTPSSSSPVRQHRRNA